MAELLIRVHDKVGSDIYQNAQLTKAGDVIVVMPNEWTWGFVERSHPDWRLLRVPTLTLSEGQIFLGAEPNRDPQVRSRVLQRRAVTLSLEALVQADPTLVTWLANDRRTTPIQSTRLTSEMFLTLQRLKTPLIDPAIIGESPLVIG
jgi:hypothetical protein